MANNKIQDAAQKVEEQLEQQPSFIEKKAKVITIFLIAVVLGVAGFVLWNNYYKKC